MTKKYVVTDWTGRTLEYYGESTSFEDAWTKVYGNFQDLEESKFEEQMGEFNVEESK